MASFPPKARRGSADGPPADSFETLLSRHEAAFAGGRKPASDPDAGAAQAAKEIAARIQAAVLESGVIEEPETGGAPEEPPADGDLAAPTLFDEEFRARIVAHVRKGLAQEAENGTDTDRRQLACFEAAVADGSVVVERAERVEGLAYRAMRSVFYGSDGRVVDDGSSESWDDDFVLAQMAQGRAIIIGTAEAIGDALPSHYYVSFPNPDVLLTFDQQLYRLAREQAEEPLSERKSPSGFF